MFTLTLSQRDADTAGDRVPELLRALADVPTLHPFRRSFGSEVVGSVQVPDDAVAATLIALRHAAAPRAPRRFAVGLGVGRVEVEEDGRFGGPGASRSRLAMESCLRLPMPVAVAAGPAGVGFDGVPVAPESAEAAQGVLRLLGEVTAARTETEWGAVDLLVPGVRGQQRTVAQVLGVSVQAVSQTITRAKWTQEWQARPAAALLLRLAAFAVE